MKRLLIIIAFLLLIVGVGTMVYLGKTKVQERELYYSGTIEATRADLSFQVSGQVTDVLVDEGDPVKQGQVVARLDDSEFMARQDQAKANLEASRENMKRAELALEIQETVLPIEVDRAGATVRAFEAQLRELKAGNREQDIEQARLSLQSLKMTMDLAGKEKGRYDRLYHEGTVSELERDAVTLRYETAAREYERARERLDLLQEGFRVESIETAEARLAESRAALRRSMANLKQIEAAQRDVEAARAQVHLAEAGSRLIETQIRYTRLHAPFDGIITSRNVEPGEVVLPAREVLSLSDLSAVDLKIFVDETEIGKVKPGQRVEIRVDTFPGKIYPGKVSYISPEGEFTPKIIQTHKERVKLVYLVKVSVPNPGLELKSGMPADAWLR